MKNYISFASNGKIIKTGICSDDSFSLQGQYVIEGTANDATQYIENGIVVDMPPKPDWACEFNYETKQWQRDEIGQIAQINMERASLLLSSDWTQLPDVPISTKQAWAEYRQALRDITSQEGYPFNVIWPTKPE
jgi:hypothetical protein